MQLIFLVFGLGEVVPVSKATQLVINICRQGKKVLHECGATQDNASAWRFLTYNFCHCGDSDVFVSLAIRFFISICQVCSTL